VITTVPKSVIHHQQLDTKELNHSLVSQSIIKNGLAHIHQITIAYYFTQCAYETDDGRLYYFLI